MPERQDREQTQGLAPEFGGRLTELISRDGWGAQMLFRVGVAARLQWNASVSPRSFAALGLQGHIGWRRLELAYTPAVWGASANPCGAGSARVGCRAARWLICSRYEPGSGERDFPREGARRWPNRSDESAPSRR